jgi:Fe-S cluster assembly ATPase SufC
VGLYPNLSPSAGERHGDFDWGGCRGSTASERQRVRLLVVVTHGAHIARYIPPQRACVLYGGTFKKCGGLEEVEEVFAYGFAKLA